MLSEQKSGWILSESGLKSVETLGNSKNLTKTLLDRDLREIGAGVLDLQKGKFESIENDLVILQVLKIRNISAPKANEASKTAPKLLKIQLTDGVHTHSAIEMEPTPLTIETKPGTKIALKIKLMKMANGQLLFTPKNIEILGGYVEALVSKWEVSRSLAGMKGARSVAAGGPPPFIPFGQKIVQNVPNADKGFKSLQASKPKESENDDSEFKAQRKDAIAEATKAGTKKTFGGGSKTLVDSNVQKIMDKGFTEDQATNALKYSRNSVEKALTNLKRREEHQKRATSNDYEPREYSKEKRFGKESRDEPTTAKPSGGVSLFDFLEKKFPTSQETAAHNERFENNISSSFKKPADKDFGDKSWADQKSSHNVRNTGGYERRDYREGGGRDQPRDYRNDRNYQPRDDNNRRDYRDSKYQQNNNNSSYPSKPNSAASNQYQKPSNGSYNNSASGDKGKYQKTDYNANKSRDYNSYASGSNRDSRDNNFKPRTAPPSKYYNEHQSNDYQKSTRNVTESMEKMSLKGNHKTSDTKLNATNYPPLTPSTNEPPPPKPKTYPSKPGYPIVGFQNKEANEHAKNVLKTKNVPAQHQQQQQPPKSTGNWQQSQQAPAPKSSMSVNVIKNLPPPPFSNPPGISQSSSAPMHSLPQPFAHPGVIHAIPANQPSAVFHQPINYPAPIIVAPPPGMAPQPVNNTQQMKVGDQCWAKYWEDGQFYSAKVTGVSDSTFVVLFMEYGNAEEVRKADCLPFVPACPTPPSNFVHQNYRQQPPPGYKNAPPAKNQPRRN